jgi:hypothetical protein
MSNNRFMQEINNKLFTLKPSGMNDSLMSMMRELGNIKK